MEHPHCARRGVRYRGDTCLRAGRSMRETGTSRKRFQVTLWALGSHQGEVAFPVRGGGVRTTPPCSSNYLGWVAFLWHSRGKKKGFHFQSLLCFSFTSSLGFKKSQKWETALLPQITQVWKLIKQQLAAQLTLGPLVDYLSGKPSYNLLAKWVLQLEGFSSLLQMQPFYFLAAIFVRTCLG